MTEKFPKIKLPFPYRPKKNSGVTEAVSKEGYVYQYSCAMLNLTKDVSPILSYWCKKNIPVENLFINEDQGISGIEENPHVTVKYGIHSSDPQDVIKLSEGFGPIELKFGNVTKFDTNPHFDVLKIDMESDKLRLLNDTLTKNLEHSDKFDEYKPHATLAYLKKGTCEELVNNDFFTMLNDVIDEIYFATRNGDEFFIEL